MGPSLTDPQSGAPPLRVFRGPVPSQLGSRPSLLPSPLTSQFTEPQLHLAS